MEVLEGVGVQFPRGQGIEVVGGWWEGSSMPVALWEFSRPLKPEEPIWRYMSVTAALNTLFNSKLRFTQLRTLNDHWEGAITPATITSQKDLMFQISEHFKREVPDQEENLRVMQLMNRFHNYVSCWTTNTPDQMQMWDSYSDSNEWCALRTTVGKLQNSLVEIPDVADIGAIKYVDPDIEPIDGIDMRREIYRKRNAFEYENEVRFTINTTFVRKDRERLLLEEPPYLFEDFDYNIIEALVIHPNASVQTEVTLERLLVNSKIRAKATRSSIARKPPLLDFKN